MYHHLRSSGQVPEPKPEPKPEPIRKRTLTPHNRVPSRWDDGLSNWGKVRNNVLADARRNSIAKLVKKMKREWMPTVRRRTYIRKRCNNIREYVAALMDIVAADEQRPRENNVLLHHYEPLIRHFTGLYTQRSLRMRYTPNVTLCQTTEQQLPSLEWIQSQVTYINSLEEPDFEILRSYSYWGDELINDYVRHGVITQPHLVFNLGHIVRQFPGVNSCEQFVIAYMNKLNELILASPELDKDIVVYRGLSVNVYGRLKAYNQFTDKGFVSTTIDPEKALSFITGVNDVNTGLPVYGEDACMCHMMIPKGSSCMFMYTSSNFPFELEITLPMNTVYYLHPHLVNKYHVDRGNVVEMKTQRLTVIHNRRVDTAVPPEVGTPLPNLSDRRIVNSHYSLSDDDSLKNADVKEEFIRLNPGKPYEKIERKHGDLREYEPNDEIGREIREIFTDPFERKSRNLKKDRYD